jgi:16S rRNA (uracil1498-N3)-methyltransferase
MRLHRFFIKHTIDKEKINSLVDSAIIHQLRRVFRLHEGDKAVFFDGSGFDYESEIVSMTDAKLEFRVIEARRVEQIAKRRVALAFSIVKKDNAEWVIQKGTELGISEFIPLVSERSEKKGFNFERAEKIMIEACEQSGRAEVPIVREPKELEEYLSGEGRKMIAFHTEGATFDQKNFIDEEDIVALVGPEGGWSEEEVKMFQERGASVMKLNSPILRAETAAVAIATLLLV